MSAVVIPLLDDRVRPLAESIGNREYRSNGEPELHTVILNLIQDPFLCRHRCLPINRSVEGLSCGLDGLASDEWILNQVQDDSWRRSVTSCDPLFEKPLDKCKNFTPL